MSTILHFSGWKNILDLAVLSIAVYVFLIAAKQARVIRVALFIAALHTGSLAASHYELVISSWVLEGAAILTFGVVILVFQPELRRSLMKLDRLLLLRRKRGASTDVYKTIADGAFALAQSRIGALMVVTGSDSIAELVDGGFGVDARLSETALNAFFHKCSPVHDGAAIIDGDRISKVNVILPLTQRSEVPAHFGTRHRAALGLSERCDASVVVVSEERGEVCVVVHAAVRLVRSTEELVSALQREDSGSCSSKRFLFPMASNNIWLKASALGVSCLLLAISSWTGTSGVRFVGVPIEFVNLPHGLQISDQSATTIGVQLRAKIWLLDSVQLGSLRVRVDLGNARIGAESIALSPTEFNLPDNVRVERIEPGNVIVDLVPRRSAK